MTPLTSASVRHIGACVLCAILGWYFAAPLEGTEFSGGSVTGPLLTLHAASGALFILSAAAVARYPRPAVAFGVVAAVLSFPLYVYFVAPGLFRTVFRGEYSVPMNAALVWNGWAIAGAVTACAATFTALAVWVQSPLPSSSNDRSAGYEA